MPCLVSDFCHAGDFADRQRQDARKEFDDSDLGPEPNQTEPISRPI